MIAICSNACFVIGLEIQNLVECVTRLLELAQAELDASKQLKKLRPAQQSRRLQFCKTAIASFKLAGVGQRAGVLESRDLAGYPVRQASAMTGSRGWASGCA